MSDTTSVPADVPEPPRPLQLSHRNEPAASVLRRRVMPDAIPDDGIAPLDVAAFTSSI
jgi:hypothetical protein